MDRLYKRIKSLAEKNKFVRKYKYESSPKEYTELTYKLDKDAKMALGSLAKRLEALEYETVTEFKTVGAREYIRMQQANGFKFDHVEMDKNYDIPVVEKIKVTHGRSVTSALVVDKEKGFTNLLYNAFKTGGYDGVRYWMQEYNKKLNESKTDYPHYYHMKDRGDVKDVESMLIAMKSHSEYCVLRTA